MKDGTYRWTCLGIFLLLAVAAEEVTIDFSTTLVTNGKQEFSRAKFVNAHGDFKTSSNATPMMEYVVDDLGVLFSRASTEGPLSGSNAFPDNPEIFEEEAAAAVNRVTCTSCDELRKRKINEDRVATNKYYIIRTIQKKQSKIDAAGEFGVSYFKNFFAPEKGFPMPKYYECFNEPLVKWRILQIDDTETERDVCSRVGKICGDFCKHTTAALPNMLVGGPAQCAAQPHLYDFARWRDRTKAFIDGALESGCLNFISEHVYASGGAVQDANLDLLETYGYKKNNQQLIPYLITETGAYNSAWYDGKAYESSPPLDARDFNILQNAFGALMSTLRTHDNVGKIITFLTLDPSDRRSSSEHRYPWSLTVGDANSELSWSPLIRYFELLKGIEGDFTYSYSDDAYVNVHAVANANKAYIMLMNFATSGSTVIDLKFPYGMPAVSEVVERQLYLYERPRNREEKRQKLERGGYMRWSNATLPGVPKKITLRAEGMSVLEFKYKNPMTELGKVERTRHYMTRIEARKRDVGYPVEIETNLKYNAYFEGIPVSPRAMAYIRVSHARRPGMEDTPELWINDVRIHDYSSKMAGPKRFYSDKYFGTFVVSYPVQQLGSNPKISLRYPDEGGWISTVVVEVDECRGRSCCLLGGRESYMECVTTTAGSRASIKRPIPMNEQLLDNPSFEQVDSKWEYSGQAKVTIKDQYWGDRSLRLVAEGASAKQTVFMKGDTNYRLHCHVKGSIRMSIERLFSTNWPEPQTTKVIYGYNHGETFDEAESSTWKNQEIDIFLKDQGDYDIILERDDGGNPNVQAGGVFADTCTLYKADALPPYVGSSKVKHPSLSAWIPPYGVREDFNLFKNPSFEKESSFGWLLKGARELRADEQLEGEQSLMLYAGGLAEQGFSLLKGHTYEFRCYIFDECPLVMEVQKSGQVLHTLEEGENLYGFGQASWRRKQFKFEARAGVHFFKIYLRWSSEPCMVDYCALIDRSR